MNTEVGLSSTRSYLVRAMHEWMSDNSQTPLIVVDATREAVQVPREHVKEGRIVLNIALAATRDLYLGNDEVSFVARFAGVGQAVSFPVEAVLAIYARESGQGMVFQAESDGAEPVSITKPEDSLNDGGPDDDPKPGPGGPHLRIVK